MHAITFLALSASIISTANAGLLRAREPTLCLFGISIFGGCGGYSTTTTNTVSTPPKGNGPCANGADVSSTYKAFNGDVYGVCLGTDFRYSDIGSVGAKSATECSDICSKTAGCVSAAWDKPSLMCWVKNTIPTPIACTTVDSIYKISSAPKSSSSTSALTQWSTVSIRTSTTSSSSTTCTTSSFTTATTSSKLQPTTSTVPDTPTCGVSGYDAGNPSASNTDFSGKYITFSSCQAFCQGSQSFAFGSNACLCYAAPVANNINASPASPYIFYDSKCPQPVVSSSNSPTITTAPVATSAACSVPVTVTVTVTQQALC